MFIEALFKYMGLIQLDKGKDKGKRINIRMTASRIGKLRKIHIYAILIFILIFGGCENGNQNKQNDKKLTKTNKKDGFGLDYEFKKLAKSKKYKSDIEYIKKEGIITTRVQALNPKTNIKTTNFKVKISQIDNSRFPEITIVVSVTDGDGNPLVVNPDLFRVEENGFTIPKKNILKIELKKDIDKNKKIKPLNVVLALDKSRSMSLEGKEKIQTLEYAKNAAVEFINQSQDNDIIRVIAFDGDLHLLGTNESAIPQIRNLNAKGSTALYAVLFNAVKELQLGGGIKAVILLTDGNNDTRGTINTSLKSITFDDGIHAANQLAIPVFAIGFGSKADIETLKKITSQTHGILFKTGEREEIKELYDKIRDIINTQYMITYKTNSIEEVTDIKVELGQIKDKRAFITPKHIVDREKRLSKEIEIVAKKSTELENLEKSLEKRLQDTVSQEKKLANELASLSGKRNELNLREEKLERKDKELRDYQIAIDNLRDKLQNLEKELDKKEKDNELEHRNLSREKESLKQKEESQNIYANTLSKKDTKLQNLEKELNSKLKSLEREKSKLLEEQKSLASKNKSLSGLINENKTKLIKLNEANINLEREKQAILKLKKKLIRVLANIKEGHKEALEGALDNEKVLNNIKP